MKLKTKAPKIRTVYIKIQEFFDSKYQASEAITVYDATAKTVHGIIQKAIERSANGK